AAPISLPNADAKITVLVNNFAETTKGFVIQAWNGENHIDRTWQVGKELSAEHNKINAPLLAFYKGEIQSLDDICEYRDLNNGGYSLTRYTVDGEFKLGTDLDMSSIEEWVPISVVTGVFDGQGHKVSNIVSSTGARIAFIATLGTSAGVPAVLKNLTVGSSDGLTYDGVSKFTLTSDVGGSTYMYPAGLVGYAHVGSTLENLTNFAAIEVSAGCNVPHRAGGIAGTIKSGVTMTNCVNYGPVYDYQESCANASKLSIGGVTGAIDGDNCVITNCANYGDVYSKAPNVLYIGGVIGKGAYISTITSCVNEGTVTNDASAYFDQSASTSYAIHIGGVIADALASGIVIDKCTNKGMVTLSNVITPTGFGLGIGGVIGYSNVNTTIKGCRNEGFVGPSNVTTGNPLAVGGILGYVTSSCVVTITKSDDGTETVNTGDFTQKVDYGNTIYIGGIVGRNNSSSATPQVIEYARNEGPITTNSKQTAKKGIYIGGICGGSVIMKYSNCVNTGNITTGSSNNNPTFYVGGISGASTNSAKVGKEMISCVSNCTINVTKGAAASRVGGLCSGFDVVNCKVQDCEVAGTFRVSRGTTVSAGTLSGYCEVNTGATDINAFEGCTITADMKFSGACWGRSSVEGEEPTASNAGILIGQFGGEAGAGVLNIGSTESPVSVQMGKTIEQTDTGRFATITLNNTPGDYGYYKNYLTGNIIDTDPYAGKIVWNTVAAE
ncbi:MAG: hypothetical protein HUJ95_00385, partial [Bacteroidales bacterium]|nr:hypothetical protein [Bacteroidales bacterium]